jgi:hypothetical protein
LFFLKELQVSIHEQEKVQKCKRLLTD